MTLYRFELAFEGEPQNIGFLHGLDNTGLSKDTCNLIEQAFSDLPVRPLNRPCCFWFRETGVEIFAPVIDRIIQLIEPRGWQIIAARVNLPIEKALYWDNYQAAFLPETIQQIHPAYREITRVKDIIHQREGLTP